MDFSTILSLLSEEYAENLSYLVDDPHHWLIVEDEVSGIIGGGCLTFFSQKNDSLLHHNSLLADFSRKLRNDQACIISYPFCWLPEALHHENDEVVEVCMREFYQKLYIRLVDICEERGIHHCWWFATETHHMAAAMIGLFPFEQEQFFIYNGQKYATGLLIPSTRNLERLNQNQTLYNNSMHRLN